MTISIPVAQQLAYTNATDETEVFDPTIRATYQKNMKLLYGSDIFQNLSGESIAVPVYNEYEAYNVGDVVYKDNLIVALESGDGAVVPAQPEVYAAFDTSIDNSTWSNRYVKLGGVWAGFPDTSYNFEADLGEDTMKYSIYRTGDPLVWESKTTLLRSRGDMQATSVKNPSAVTTLNDGYGAAWVNPNNILSLDTAYVTKSYSGFGGDSSYTNTMISSGYDFSEIPDSAIITGIEVQIRQYASGGAPDDKKVQLYQGSIGKGTAKSSTGTAMTISTKIYGGNSDLWGWNEISPTALKSSTFGVGFQKKDVNDDNIYVDSIQVIVYYTEVNTQETIMTLNGVDVITRITPNTVETKANVIWNENYPTYAECFSTIIVRDDGVYARTNIDAGIEYVTETQKIFVQVDSPEAIGFTPIEKSNIYRPFDNKNYSFASKNGNMFYSLYAAGGFTSIGLGKIVCDLLQIDFKDNLGNIIKTIQKSIDCTLLNTDIVSPKTEIFYAEATAYSADIQLFGSYTQVGTLALAKAVDAGITHLEMKHSLKDWSTFEQDIFGNPSYIERPTVLVNSGTVYIRTLNYDDTVRFLQYLNKKTVIIDGSDSSNKNANGSSIFDTTKIIGRFMSIGTGTTVKDNDIERISQYSFSIEEIV
ncbi:MAG TPA: hypothetical protein CFH81_02150 [Sulfurovum sp. UBA12169]|nr:MAG TPA: hypothetical protein CFH81_02150 [Sulfurovum sp. UBA12169]